MDQTRNTVKTTKAAAVPKTMTDQNCIKPQLAPAVSRTQTHAVADEFGHHLNLRTADQGSSPSEDIKTCLCILGGRVERGVVQSSRALHQGSLLCRSSNKLYLSKLHHSTWSRSRRTGKLPAPAARWRGWSPSLLQDSRSAPPSSNNCATSRFPNKKCQFSKQGGGGGSCKF